MVENAFELVKTVGSLSGFASLGLVLLDRWFSARPVAYVHFERDKTVSNARPTALLRVVNPTDIPMLIMSVKAASPAYKLATSNEPEGLISAQMGRSPSFFLASKETRDLFLVAVFENGTPIEARGEQPVVFEVRWRRGDKTAWWQWPLRVKTTTGHIRRFGTINPDNQ